MRYLAGFGVHAQQTVMWGTGSQPVAGSPMFLHGDLTRSTTMTTPVGGTGSQPVTAYTAFGDPVVWDSQSESWRVGWPVDLGTRYQYDGGWGYESGAWGPGPDGQGAAGGPLALWGENTGLPPVTLQHVGWRWYQPSIGRFIQRDPIGLRGGLNVYAYVENDPLDDLDAEGLGPVKTQWGWRDPATGRWTKPPWLFRKLPKFITYKVVYDIELYGFRTLYCIMGEPYPGDPGDQLWDLMKDLERLREQDARNARQRGDRGPGPRPIWCFVGGTPVVARDGVMSIEDARAGTFVLAWSPRLGEHEWAEVTHIHTGVTNELVLLSLEHETLVCTAQHPFWHADRGWTPAGELVASDMLLDSQLQSVRLINIEHVELAAPIRVYNLTVSGAQTYFVGCSEVLVHNKKP